MYVLIVNYILLLVNKISFGENTLLYKYNDNKVKSLHIMLPKVNVYVKRYG